MIYGVLTATVVACVIAAFVMGLGSGLASRITRADAVTHGCAEYNSTTGKFQWKEGEK